MKPFASLKWSASLGCALLLGGCTVGPNYTQPQTPVPGAFSRAEPSTRPTTQVVSTTQPAVTAQTPWWTTFEDPALDRLIEQAARANLDLKAAEARVREARAARGVVAADWWPTVDGGASYTRSKGSENLDDVVLPPCGGSPRGSRLRRFSS
jgi:outer membrane protein TolC